MLILDSTLNWHFKPRFTLKSQKKTGSTHRRKLLKAFIRSILQCYLSFSPRKPDGFCTEAYGYHVNFYLNTCHRKPKTGFRLVFGISQLSQNARSLAYFYDNLANSHKIKCKLRFKGGTPDLNDEAPNHAGYFTQKTFTLQ